MKLWHRMLKPPPLVINHKAKGIKSLQNEMCNHIYNFTSKVRLPHFPSRDSRSHETFLAYSANKQYGNYDIECFYHHPFLSTVTPKGYSHSKMKWWDIYTNLPVNLIVRLLHPRRGDSQCQETFLAPSSDKQTSNYNTECSNHHPSLRTLRPKWLSRRKMKWWAIYTNLPVNV